MARKPRLHVAGGFSHVILRGNDGEKIFFSNKDRARLFQLIQEGTERFQYRLHAYCFMSNHIHLIIQVGAIPLSKIVQNLSFRYTKYINKKKNRVGHLFQGRYKAILIDADSYMLELVRYIHNNPVRAGMTIKADDYKWSSHQVYLGAQELSLLTTDWILGQFAKTKPAARRKFAEFVERGVEEGHREDLYIGEHDSRVLGDDGFVERVLQQKNIIKKPSIDVVVKYVCKQNGLMEKELSSPSRERKMSAIRGIIGWLVMQFEITTLSEVANRFNRDLTTISRSVRNTEEQRKKSKDLRKQLEVSLLELSK
ncbi:MAG: transposase [Proteobacteria bacterium]|nr:transposase [Pseudomonadota bacterium]MBU1708676.1 transposase [Pseudomonadota bacterium]